MAAHRLALLAAVLARRSISRRWAATIRCRRKLLRRPPRLLPRLQRRCRHRHLTGPTGRAFPGSGQRLATLPPSASPQDEYDMAYGYVLHKDYSLAEQSFRDYLKKYPNERLVPEAHYWLGESLFQQQRYRDAAVILPRGVNQVRTFLEGS